MKIFYGIAIAIFTLIFTGINVKAEDTAIEFTTIKGEKIMILLDKFPKISFPDQNTVLVESEEGNFTFDYDDLETYRIVNGAGVENIISQEGNVGVKLETGNIVVKGLSSGISATLYSIDGVLLKTSKPDSEGTCRISTEGLGKGVYIIVADQFKCKIIL